MLVLEYVHNIFISVLYHFCVEMQIQKHNKNNKKIKKKDLVKKNPK